MRPPTLNIFPSQPMHVDPSASKLQVLNAYKTVNESGIINIGED